MVDQKKSAQRQYLEELSRNLQRAGFEAAWVESEEKLLVSREGVYLCRVNGEGTVFYKQEIVDALDAQAELDRIVDIANDTGEYITMLSYAPPLKAQGLTGFAGSCAFSFRKWHFVMRTSNNLAVYVKACRFVACTNMENLRGCAAATVISMTEAGLAALLLLLYPLVSEAVNRKYHSNIETAYTAAIEGADTAELEQQREAARLVALRFRLHHCFNCVPIPEQNAGSLCKLFRTGGKVCVRHHNADVATVKRFPCVNFLYRFVSQVAGVAFALHGVFNTAFFGEYIHALISASLRYCNVGKAINP